MPHETVIIYDDLAVVMVSRELESGNRETVNRLRDLCRKQVDKNTNLIIDFSNVNVCPSLVWGNLLVLAKRATKNGQKIALCCLRPTVEKAVQIIGLAKYMDIFSERNEAVKAMQEKQDG